LARVKLVVSPKAWFDQEIDYYLLRWLSGSIVVKQ